MIDLLRLAAGLVGLYLGAEWLVRGASRIAALLRVPTLVIGLTVVAFGTSMPEVVAGAVAAWRGSTDVALGNVLGSNVANVGLILGVSALIAAVPVGLQVLYREVPLMLGATLLTWALAFDGRIGRVEGGVLLLSLLAATAAMLLWSRQGGDGEVERELAHLEQELGIDPRASMGREAARVVVGLAVISLGAHLLVESAVAIARSVGVSEFLISVSIVAVGTSLPELATSVVAALRGEADMLVGNLVGSNIFNLLGALAVAALITPVPVAPEVLAFDFPVVFGFSVAMALALRRHGGVVRWEGALLLVGYAAYIGLSIA